MTDTVFSPGVVKGLEHEIGHPPPFSSGDLDGVWQIQVLQDEVPRGLERLTGLEVVTYRGCEVIDFESLRNASKLNQIVCWSSNVTSVDALPRLFPKLDWVDLRVGQVQDLRPLLELPLKFALLAGNPIDEESFRYVYPELQRRGAIESPETQPEFLIHEREWALMRLFVARGLRISAYQVGKKTRLAVPGHLLSTNPELLSRSVSARQARKILDDDPAIDERRFFDMAAEIAGKDGYVE